MPKTKSTINEAKLKNIAFWLFLIILVLLIFRNWFGFSEISSGDAPFYFYFNLKAFTFLPSLWFEGGLGQFSSLLHPIFYLAFPLKILAFFNLPWTFIERVLWYWPFLVITIFSSWYLARTIFPKNVFLFLSPLVFLFNSYILMIIGGGQVSIALSYAISPLVIALFLRNLRKVSLVLAIISGLILALELAFEPRITALTIAVVILYLFFDHRSIINSLKIFLVPLVIVMGIHFYWLLPTILLQKTSYLPSLSSSDWVSFLSFAQFSNSFSLLHPNWPENIFGKIYFMRPEFLVVPILAYISLLFISLKLKVKSTKLQLKVKSDSNLTIEQFSNRNILFFALLGLIGAFLAKGSNPPFGEVYLWLFKNMPGMNLFRDPTKFYTLVALSYSVLIPFSISKIYEWIKSQTKFSIFNFQFSIKSKIFNFQNLFLIFAISYLLFLIRPAWLGQLGGTFKAKEVPPEYVALKDFLSSQPEFFRTFWIPQRQRFGFYSNNHPAIGGQEFFKVASPSAAVEKLREQNAQEILAQAGIKYVIIPYDSEREIFLKDRKYNHEQRLNLEKELDRIAWLTKSKSCCSNDLNHDIKVAIYEVPNFRDHFWVKEDAVDSIKYRMINPTKYEVGIKNATQPFTLVFSETFDPLWQVKVDGQKIPSQKIYENLNSFVIPKLGSYDIEVEFEPQKYVYYGMIVSLTTFLVTIWGLVYFLKREANSSLYTT